MKFKEQPIASAKEMFTAVQPAVRQLHKQYRETLDNIVREENGQLPTASPSQPSSQNDSYHQANMGAEETLPKA